MSDDPAGGPGEPTDPTPGASATPDSSDLESKLHAVRDENAKIRIAKRDATQAADAAKKQAADAEARLAAVMKAAGLEVSDDGGANVEAIQAAADAKSKKAEDVVIRARFESLAVQAGFDPETVGDVYTLAKSKNMIDSADVDMDDASVTGLENAVQEAVEKMPQFLKSTTKTTAAGVDTRTPGKTKGGLDFSKIEPGDITNMSSEEYAAFKASSPQIKTGRFVQDASGNLVPEVFGNPHGGNALDRSMRRALADKEAAEKALGEI